MSHNWTWRPLGELFDIGAGKTMSAAARNGGDKVRFLRTSNVFWDRLDLSTLDEMAIPAHELPDKLVKAGDLLVCEGGEIGRAAIWDGSVAPMAFQNHLHRLRSKRDDVDPQFYVYFLQSAFTQLGIFEGTANKTTIPNLSAGRLAALDIPHPPLAEQRAIARALRAVRKAQTLHESLLAITSELKSAAMNDLFTKGLRGEPPKETELGVVPSDWVSVRIGELGQVIVGTTPPTRDAENYARGTIPFVTPGDIDDGRPITKTTKMLSERGLSVSRPLPPDSTCFVCIGSTIGKVGITTAPVCTTNQQINAVIPSSRYHRRYVFHLLTHWSDRVQRHSSPSPVPILPKGAFEGIAVFTSTDVAEQREIADILDAIDDRIAVLTQKRAAGDQLMSVLLRRLLSGEIRVEDLNLSALTTTEIGVA